MIILDGGIMGTIGGDKIKDIEKIRNSKVIVYFTGDRPFELTHAMITEDAVRYLYDHLLSLKFEEGNTKIIDLFLYSRGGDVSVPWRIVSMIREFCDEFNVLIPYKAHSAATLLSLGADTIIMGKKAELGPIDPTLSRKSVGGPSTPPQDISVEDVNSFVSFIKETANINDQAAVAQLL
jgi:ClpP class serine protease